MDSMEDMLFEEQSIECPQIGYGLNRSVSEDSLMMAIMNEDPENKWYLQPENKMSFVAIQRPNEKKPKVKRQKIITKKVKRKGKGLKGDYRKNICGYITKKIIREFINETFRDKVQELCDKHSTEYNQIKDYYSSRIEGVTGPSHIPSLIEPTTNEEAPLKKVFKEFFEWFLKERYIRYLLLEGKMEKKEVYIRYKNEALFHILNSSEDRQSHDGSETGNSDPLA